LAAILKILKTKSTTLSDNLFLCQVSKGSAVLFPRTCRTNFYIGGHFVFFQLPKAATHYGGYSYKVS